MESSTWQLILTLAAIAGGAYATFRAASTQQSNKMQGENMTEMRSTIGELRETIRFNQEQADRKIAETKEAGDQRLREEVERRHQGERECTKQIGELQGQVAAMRDGAVKMIVDEAMALLERKLDERTQ
jgi:hypothetical protein